MVTPADAASGSELDRRSFLRLWAAVGLGPAIPALLAGCESGEPAAPAPAVPLDPDNAPGAVTYDRLVAVLGRVPDPRGTYRMGVVVKYLGNEYWKLLADGMQSTADRYGVALDVQGAASESDPAGQLSIMEGMVDRRYDALLLSPQTDENLSSAVRRARQAGIKIINVDDAVLADAEHFLGPKQYENGVRAARYFIDRVPQGGKVAVIEGQAGVYAARQRTMGFKDSLVGSKFTVVASLPGDWDLQKSLELAAGVIHQHPDIRGFYCNNDIMALGVVQAVDDAGRSGRIIVIGTDGIRPAYDSIRAGGLTATVDSFPFRTGQIALEIALRLMAGQGVPRVVFSPQNLVTRENVENPLPK